MAQGSGCPPIASDVSGSFKDGRLGARSKKRAPLSLTYARTVPARARCCGSRCSRPAADTPVRLRADALWQRLPERSWAWCRRSLSR